MVSPGSETSVALTPVLTVTTETARFDCTLATPFQHFFLKKYFSFLKILRRRFDPSDRDCYFQEEIRQIEGNKIKYCETDFFKFQPIPLGLRPWL